MAVTGTETYRELITDALLDIEAGTLGQAATATALAHGVRIANRMLKRWQMLGYLQGQITVYSETATTNASNTLTVIRPFRILHVNWKNTDGIETPMVEMTRQEYDELPDKDSTGVPTQFHYDRQNESALFYQWPLPSAVTTETWEITGEAEIEDIADEDDTVDLPAEAYDAFQLNLAARLAPSYGSEQRKLTIKMDAKQALDEYLADQNEGTVRFFGD
jgi:hypothetical protein